MILISLHEIEQLFSSVNLQKKVSRSIPFKQKKRTAALRRKHLLARSGGFSASDSLRFAIFEPLRGSSNNGYNGYNGHNGYNGYNCYNIQRNIITIIITGYDI